jgi:hypothetical protein
LCPGKQGTVGKRGTVNNKQVAAKANKEQATPSFRRGKLSLASFSRLKTNLSGRSILKYE